MKKGPCLQHLHAVNITTLACFFHSPVWDEEEATFRHSERNSSRFTPHGSRFLRIVGKGVEEERGKQDVFHGNVCGTAIVKSPRSQQRLHC